MNIINRIKECCFGYHKIPDIQECILNDKTDNECLICLESFKDKETVIRLKCNHYYHTHCIYTWFEKKQTCPICDEILKI